VPKTKRSEIDETNNLKNLLAICLIRSLYKNFPAATKDARWIVAYNSVYAFRAATPTPSEATLLYRH
jgi:hypothetical protein